MYPIIVFVIIVLVQWLGPIIAQALRRLFARRIPLQGIYLQQYTQAKILYVHRFNEVPGIAYINDLDATRAIEYIRAYYGNSIQRMYQYNRYDYSTGSLGFSITIFILSDERMIELGNGYAEVLYGQGGFAFAEQLISELADFRIGEDLSLAAPMAPATIMGFMRREDLN